MFLTHVPFCSCNPGAQLSETHLLVLGSKCCSFVHGGGCGEHGIASAIVGHDGVHDGSLGFIVQLVGCGLGHDGSLGFIVQKPPLPTLLDPPMPLLTPPELPPNLVA
jgi:hypothetical protein